ncbi:MAG TPA: LysR family transcriptional regulator [Dermatophilaceae bacterium]|nr:LysR family transcriptional regulator [Dermatophilaceae bacterium]
MLDPHRLRVLRSVLASGSITLAAENLGLTSSAVSQHVSALRRETGLVLFERVGRGIVPTPAARILAEQSDGALAELARLDELVADLREGRSGRLTLGYFSSAGLAWMPDLVKRLTGELPDLTVELVLTEAAAPGVAPDIDLVVDLPDAPTRPGFARTSLTDDPYVVVVPAGHPLADRERVALTDLRRERWVSGDLLHNPSHRILLSACAAAGFRPRFPVQAGDQYTAMAFVAAGVGVTVLPRLAAAALPEGVRRLPLTPPAPVRHLSALTRDTATPTRAAVRALELLTEIIRAAGPTDAPG